jgi:hypothetical protein
MYLDWRSIYIFGLKFYFPLFIVIFVIWILSNFH